MLVWPCVLSLIDSSALAHAPWPRASSGRGVHPLSLLVLRLRALWSLAFSAGTAKFHTVNSYRGNRHADDFQMQNSRIHDWIIGMLLFAFTIDSNQIEGIPIEDAWVRCDKYLYPAVVNSWRG